MQPDSVLHLNSTAALRSHAGAWDRLWRQSDVTQPTARAELVAYWVDTFADPHDFRAVVLRDGDRFVAALPLLHRRVGRLMEAYGLPGNEWSPAGDLLLDAEANRGVLCDQLVAELAVLPRSLFWFDAVPIDSCRWRQFTAALHRAGVPADRHHRFDVAWLATTGTRHQAEAKLSKDFRRKLRKSKRLLEDNGSLRLQVVGPRDARQLGESLTSCLELEHAGWKGRAGSSILSTPAIRDFVVGQAQRLARCGHVQIASLWHDERLIAFEYAWQAKRVYHAFKVAYDQKYAHYSPGQMLTWMLLQRQLASPTCQAVDGMGPANQAALRWRPELRPVSRLVFAPRSAGRTFLYAYRHFSPSWRQLRKLVTRSPK
jgi:CelD/BcsL family acetyltransferase involved in cellulose biosynthesis